MFLAVLRRDLYVTWRELPVFLAQVVLQPLFLLFVFGRVLADLGFTHPGYTEVLFPGIVAMTVVLTALQSTAFPLVIDFSFTKEIEDRLLAPMPVGMVGVEKIVFAAMRALVAAHDDVPDRHPGARLHPVAGQRRAPARRPSCCSGAWSGRPRA